MQYAENWVLFRCVLTTWIYTVHEQVHPVVFTLVSLIAGLPIGFDRICFFFTHFAFQIFYPLFLLPIVPILLFITPILLLINIVYVTGI